VRSMIYAIHQFVFWTCVSVAFVVSCIMVHSVLNFRRTERFTAHGAKMSSTKVEVVWAVIPLAILVLMGFPAAETILRMKDTRAPALSTRLANEEPQWQDPYWVVADGGSSFGTPASAKHPSFKVTRGNDYDDRSESTDLCASSRAPTSIVGSPLCAGNHGAIVHGPVAAAALP